jgi:hypothetical protein
MNRLTLPGRLYQGMATVPPGPTPERCRLLNSLRYTRICCAGIFKLAGAYSYLSLWIAVGLNAVFSAFNAVAILRIGKRTFGTATGVLAAWIWSCWIYEAVVSIRLWESSLSSLLLAVGLLLLPELAESLRPSFEDHTVRDPHVDVSPCVLRHPFVRYLSSSDRTGHSSACVLRCRRRRRVALEMSGGIRVEGSKTLRSGLHLNGSLSGLSYKIPGCAAVSVMMFFSRTVEGLPQLPRPELQRRPTPVLPARLTRAVGRVLNSPIAVFFIALIARFTVLSQFLPTHGWNNGFYRFNEPSRIAAAPVSGVGYSAPWLNTIIVPTAQQPPLYPLSLAGIFKMAGAFTYLSLWTALGVNAMFSAVTAVLVLRIGRREFDTFTGALTAWVWRAGFTRRQYRFVCGRAVSPPCCW